MSIWSNLISYAVSWRQPSSSSVEEALKQLVGAHLAEAKAASEANLRQIYASIRAIDNRTLAQTAGQPSLAAREITETLAAIQGDLDRIARDAQLSEKNIGTKLEWIMGLVRVAEENIGIKLDLALRAIQVAEANVGIKLEDALRSIQVSEANVGLRLNRIIDLMQTFERLLDDETSRIDSYLTYRSRELGQLVHDLRGEIEADPSRTELQLATRTLDERLAYLVGITSSNEVVRKPYSFIPINGGEHIIVPSRNFDFVIPTIEAGLCAAMCRGVIDLMEPGVSAIIREHVRPGDYVIDAGANIGLHSMSMASLVGPNGRVLAFEPTSRLAKALSMTTGLNGFYPRIEVIKSALADREGTADFRVSAHGPQNSLYSNNYNEDAEVTSVPITSLDAVIPEGQAVNFIKMDVEGAEPAVWAGMGRVISQSVDLCCVLEWSRSHFIAAGSDPRAFAEAIRADGFEIFQVLDNGASKDPLESSALSTMEFGNVFLRRRQSGR